MPVEHPKDKAASLPFLAKFAPISTLTAAGIDTREIQKRSTEQHKNTTTSIEGD